MLSMDEMIRWLKTKLKDENLLQKTVKNLVENGLLDASYLQEEDQTIARREFSDKQYFFDGYWYDLYHSRASSLSDLPLAYENNEQVVEIFDEIVSFANAVKYRKKTGREVSEDEARFQGVFLSDTLMDTLFQLVKSAFSHRYQKNPLAWMYGQKANYIKNQLGMAESNDLIDLIYYRVNELNPGCFVIEEEEMIYWWDEKGELCKKWKITPKQINRFEMDLPKRTLLFRFPPLLIRSLLLFDRLLARMELALMDPTIHWRNLSMKRYVQSRCAGQEDGLFRHHIYENLFKQIFRLCENEVRKKTGVFAKLSIEDSMKELYYRLPKKICMDIQEELEKYQIPAFSKQEILEMFPEDKQAWDLARLFIMEGGKEEFLLDLLNTLDEKKANRFLKNIKVSGDYLLLTYFLKDRQNKRGLNKKERIQVEHWIHPSRRKTWKLWQKMDILDIPEGEEEFRKKETWASFLFSALLLLKKRPIRHLDLKVEKIKKSREDLEDLILMVDTFLETEEESDREEKQEESLEEEVEEVVKGEKFEEEIEKEKDLVEDDEILLLKQLLEKIRIPRGTFDKENLLLANINDKAYDDLGDALLFWDQDDMTFDSWDRDWIVDYLERKDNDTKKD